MSARTKPLTRGWSHAGAALATLPLAGLLCWECRNDVPRLISIIIFSLSMFSLYTVSALYHIGRWRPGWERFFHAFDHSNIFLLIAGTYTPICFNVMDGWLRPALLGLVWTLALAGIIMSVWAGRRVPRSVKVGLYIGLGWLGVLGLPSLVALPLEAIGFMLLGGLLYTAGSLIYGLRRPDPSPGYFGYHEIFHLFVIAGGAMFLIAIWGWVLPYPRA